MNTEISDLRKAFGNNEVLRGISFTASGGSAFGLLGRNGAGKTTTIRIIMDVFPADGGTVLFDGKPKSEANVKIGYLPEERGMYPKKKIIEQLVFFGELKGLSAKTATQNAKRWLERLEMSEYLTKRLDTLSKGNQQKIQLAATLIDDPDLIILDEPFSGLDPVNAEILKKIVRELVENGKTVIFSSHQMSYVEEFCDSIAIMKDGKIALEGNLRDIKRRYPRTNMLVEYQSEAEAQSVLSALDTSFGVAERDGVKLTVNLRDESLRSALLEKLVAVNDNFDKFTVIEPSLQDIFIDVQKEADA